MQNHNVCVTEHEKYALGATKPGGYAANGFTMQAQTANGKADGEVVGTEFLSERPPWRCR